MSNEDPRLDTLFTVLANKHRRALVHNLSFGPSTISELAKREHLSLPAIHKHIKLLEEVSLIQRKKNGRCNFLALDRDALNILRTWITEYNGYWGNNSESLENYIETLEKKATTNT